MDDVVVVDCRDRTEQVPNNIMNLSGSKSLLSFIFIALLLVYNVEEFLASAPFHDDEISGTGEEIIFKSYHIWMTDSLHHIAFLLILSSICEFEFFSIKDFYC